MDVLTDLTSKECRYSKAMNNSLAVLKYSWGVQGWNGFTKIMKEHFSLELLFQKHFEMVVKGLLHCWVLG